MLMVEMNAAGKFDLQVINHVINLSDSFVDVVMTFICSVEVE